MKGAVGKVRSVERHHELAVPNRTRPYPLGRFLAILVAIVFVGAGLMIVALALALIVAGISALY
jgi:hypothetical protein